MFQDSLIPNSIFLLPLLKSVAEYDGPITLEEVTPEDEQGMEVYVKSDDIRVAIPVAREVYAVDVTLEGQLERFTFNTQDHLSPFHMAWLSDALKFDALAKGWKLTLKAEFKNAVFLRGAGLNASPAAMRNVPECYVVAEAWLQMAVQKGQHDRNSALVEAAYEGIRQRREVLREIEKDRQRREQKANAAELPEANAA